MMRARFIKGLTLIMVVGLAVQLGACGARLNGGASGGTGRSTSAGGGLSIPFP
ncbi:MAG: hypothetical protein PHS60_00610 [Zavarzinia sp.]|nr:hypothetical protein [Zavarzinia sp.]